MKMKSMSSLEAGNRVQVSDRAYSDVYMFTHKVGAVATKMTRIESKGNVLELSPGQNNDLTTSFRTPPRFYDDGPSVVKL